MPGHINAAQVAYPELTCDGAAPPLHGRGGRIQLAVVGKEETYVFVEDVIREVAALTPGPYLHIGGDEARRHDRRGLPHVRHEGSPAGREVRQAGDRLVRDRRGRSAGDGGPAVLADRDASDGVARAAVNGNKVIMSPADKAYLDMKYDPDSRLGLAWAGIRGGPAGVRLGSRGPLPGVGEERAARRGGGAVVGDVAYADRRADDDVPAAAGDCGDRRGRRANGGSGSRSGGGSPRMDSAGTRRASRSTARPRSTGGSPLVTSLWRDGHISDDHATDE